MKYFYDIYDKWICEHCHKDIFDNLLIQEDIPEYCPHCNGQLWEIKEN